MAERRMVSKKIVDTDLFLDMPATTRLLYYDLLVRADDDGFVGSPKKITKMVGGSDDDLKLLVAKQFLIPFESGVCVIRDWKIHNYIQSDRYHKTQYVDEKSLLTTTPSGSYSLNLPDMDTECIQDAYKMDTEVRLGKVSIGKINNKLGAEAPTQPSVIDIVLNDKSLYSITQTQIDKWKELYPAVDILQELRKMVGWCEANTAKRKTKRGILPFINRWLAKQQDSGPANKQKNDAYPYKPLGG